MPPTSPRRLGSEAATRLLLVTILVVAGYLRLSHVNWDSGTHIHPDERFLTLVEDALKLPDSLGQFFCRMRKPLASAGKAPGPRSFTERGTKLTLVIFHQR